MSQSSNIYIEFLLRAQIVRMPKNVVPFLVMCSLVEKIRYRHKRNHPTMENTLSEAVGKLKRRGEGEREEKRILLSELCPRKIQILKPQSPRYLEMGALRRC